MKNKTTRNSFLLVLTALIWGIAFVAQSEGGKAAGPFTFNCIRSFIGGLVLIPVIKIIDKINPDNKKPVTKKEKNTLLLGGICCGTALFLASSFQQSINAFGSGIIVILYIKKKGLPSTLI